VERISNPVSTRVTCARREGDPPSLVADSTRLRQSLGWSPQHSDLKTIVKTAWNFYNVKR